MRITVDEDMKTFYLACDERTQAIGHGIQVGKYQFCAIPTQKEINVSEVTTGMKIIGIPMNLNILLQTETKEETMIFFFKIGRFLEIEIGRHSNFDTLLKQERKRTAKKLGEMPEIEVYVE